MRMGDKFSLQRIFTSTDGHSQNRGIIFFSIYSLNNRVIRMGYTIDKNQCVFQIKDAGFLPHLSMY